MLRRYTFKLYPNVAQETAVREQLLMMGQLWNALLQRREDVYRRERRTLTAYDQKKEITQLRAECPEWAALSVAAARGVVDRLDNAFKAFFKRAKSGAGAQSGYPRYKRADRWSSISFAERSGSGWRIWREKPGKGGWRVYIKGVAGHIKARGLLPAEPLACNKNFWRTGEIIWRDGAWWLSVVCEIEPRIKHGAERIAISFDLIDEFAVVEAAKGRSPACLKEQITPVFQQGDAESPAGPYGLGGDGNLSASFWNWPQPAGPYGLGGDGNVAGADAQTSIPAGPYGLGGDGNDMRGKADQLPPAGPYGLGGDGNGCPARKDRPRPAGPYGLGGDGNTLAPRCDVASRGDGNIKHRPPAGSGGDGNHLRPRADVIQSARDRRYVKFSWRWRQEKKRVARIKAREARRRRYIHHGWSTAIIRRATDLTITIPSIPEWIETPRGNVREWGANVAIVSEFNRHVLGQAPMLAVQMLQYKAQEAGIRCDVVKDDEAPNIAVGRDLVVVGKAKRRLRRAIKREAA